MLCLPTLSYNFSIGQSRSSIPIDTSDTPKTPLKNTRVFRSFFQQNVALAQPKSCSKALSSSRMCWLGIQLGMGTHGPIRAFCHTLFLYPFSESTIITTVNTFHIHLQYFAILVLLCVYIYICRYVYHHIPWIQVVGL